MAKRVRIGINFTHDENWIGGTYYITNLVSALKTLPDSHKPQIIVLTWNESDYDMIRQTGYPHLAYQNFFIPLNPVERIVNKTSRIISDKNVINKVLSSKQVDVVFPCYTSKHFEKVSRKIFWIPDFQEIYYPNFFSADQIENRKRIQKTIIDSASQIVFSSNNAIADFQKIYPNAKNKIHVLNFAVTHPEFSSVEINWLKEKYQITQKYFFVPNQFWIHKNQTIVLKAIAELKDRKDFQVVFTGKESDVRNPDYFNSLKKIVSDNSLQDIVRFLGFIDRREQLKLMSESLAVVQPSLFEGWSTVVEDAKAMNKYILLSDIPVHREQITDNCTFFNPNNENALASEMQKIILNGVDVKCPINYSENVKKFASDFIAIVNKELS